MRAARRVAFMPYVTSGYPSSAAMPGILSMLKDARADAIELGVPFSDPIADGGTVQAASQASLERGGGLGPALRHAALAARLGHRVVLMSYANPLYQAGLERLARRLHGIGVQGLIVPDLPLEEAHQWSDVFARQDVALSMFAAPTTPADRLRAADRAARGFIYYASLTGVTGERANLFAGLERRLRAIRRIVRAPVCVGFGISTPRQVATVGRCADGVIVGSALVRRLADWPAGRRQRRRIALWTRSMARAANRE